ncbi:MAG: twin-arginine translocase TatA/TatE family subunit [Crocinitomicaceae bacterium]
MLLILNDVAGSEILLILVFVLIFFGSKSIPSLAQTMGRTIRQIKDASSDIQNELKKSGAEMKKDLNLEGFIKETTDEIRRPLDQMADDIDSTIKYQPPNRNSHVKPIQGKQVYIPVKELTEEEPSKVAEIKESIDDLKSKDSGPKSLS